MSDASQDGNSERKWQGLAPAQAFVLPSYQWAVSRYEAADTRIQTILTLVATVTFAVPTLSRAARPELSFVSVWFFGALVVAATVAVVGLVARLRGTLILQSPALIYKKWRDFSEIEFQQNALYFAGEHFEKNRLAISRKAHAVAWVAGLFLCEMSLFLLWVICA